VGAWILEFIEEKLGRDLWSCALDKGDSARVLFIDYTYKAFDHLDHTILLNKLISLDVPNCQSNGCFPFQRSQAKSKNK